MSTSEITWDSTILSLLKNKPTKTSEKLEAAGVVHLRDLLWLFPLRISTIPKIKSFESLTEDSFFKGVARKISIKKYRNFRARGKKNIPLQNITLVAQDYLSKETITLRWFNCYPSVVKKVEQGDFFSFSGLVQISTGKFQIVNPETTNLEEEDISAAIENSTEEEKVQYSTINQVSSTHFKKVVNKIPKKLWTNIPDQLEDIPTETSNSLLPLGDALRFMHGKTNNKSITREDAEQRLIYQEFFIEQVKLLARRESYKSEKALPINIKKNQFYSKLIDGLPFKLTKDQEKVLLEIKSNFKERSPMMRLVQGDVGCGKTLIGLLSALIVIENGYQVAFMCPTESLALQHYINIKNDLENFDISIELLTGSLKPKAKKLLQDRVNKGEVDFVIGTHSLFQDNLTYKKLGLAIIDEQHKFGVKQRLKLVNKTKGCHCLIMTATPIPRSLSLTQYGDLDISIIKTMPAERKGVKTKIVKKDKFETFLSFLKTRVSIGEQGYIVVPAIEESETLDIANVKNVYEDFKDYFPEMKIEMLHGKIKSEEKADIFIKFKNQEIDLLISTSVIEVGINVKTATVMAIMNPERFGLSSLHQLRGRVGRGEKIGFCFLLIDEKVQNEGISRLSIIEKNTDGFIISEEDLKIRGEGNLLGVDQSGSVRRKIANIISHNEVLNQVREDIEKLEASSPKVYNSFIKKYKSDIIVTHTI